MGLETVSRQRATRFKGLITNADERDIGAGAAQIQDNLQCLVDGRLECRGGNRPLTFDNGITSVAGQVIAAFYFQTPSADWVIFQDSVGRIRVGKNGT